MQQLEGALGAKERETERLSKAVEQMQGAEAEVRHVLTWPTMMLMSR